MSSYIRHIGSKRAYASCSAAPWIPSCFATHCAYAAGWCLTDQACLLPLTGREHDRETPVWWGYEWARFGHNGQEADEWAHPAVQELCWLLRMMLKSSQPLTRLPSNSVGKPRVLQEQCWHLNFDLVLNKWEIWCQNCVLLDHPSLRPYPPCGQVAWIPILCCLVPVDTPVI